MVIEDEFKVNASAQRTWDFLMNITELVSCVPSIQKIGVLDDRNFPMTVSQKVGPFSVTFETQISFTEMDPPHHLLAHGKGKDKMMGGNDN
jgi:carbon monoxide dehydrogenase subunit G